MVSTCPWTKWPPSRSPTLSARSRLTRSPARVEAEVGAGQGLGSRLDVESFAVGRDDRQAATVDGHALAEHQRLDGREFRPGDREAPARPLRDVSSIRPSPSTNPVNTSGPLPVSAAR